MSEQTPKTKAYVISDFKDAGTGENFTAGSMPSIETGTFANYEAAGLVRKATPEDGKAKPAA